MYKNIQLNKWIEVSRVQTGMVTALALWVGYASVQNMDLQTFGALGLIGLLVHVWGFILNEVNDKEYDERHSTSGNPLSSDEISTRHANIVAWVCGTIAITFSYIAFGSNIGLVLLLMSFIAGLFYNNYSKVHWWSNIYLSGWVLLLTFSGAAFAGSFNMYTWILGIALSIQIFVQVIEGDLKDILGPEKTMANHIGVECDGTVMDYPPMFRKGINVIKMVELGLLGYIVYDNISLANGQDILVLGGFTLVASVFLMTATFYLTGTLDRDKIKKRSSVHELSSVVMFGITAYWLDNSSAILIALAPVVWYLMINKMLYKESLNPDV